MAVALLMEAFHAAKVFVSESIYIAEGGSTWEVLGLLFLCVCTYRKGRTVAHGQLTAIKK